MGVGKYIVNSIDDILFNIQEEILETQQKAIDIQQRLLSNFYCQRQIDTQINKQIDLQIKLKIAENTPALYDSISCQEGIVEVDKKSLLYIDSSLRELIEKILLIYDERQSGCSSIKDPKIIECQKLQQLERLKIQVLALNKIVKNLHTLLAKLNTRHSFVLIEDQIAFVSNNKIPAPDDEDSKRKKLPISIAQELANLLDLTDKEMANVLTISIRTYHRLKLNGLLNPVASERLKLLKDLAEYGLEVFEDQNNFNKWLRLPIPELSNYSPLNSLDTATGFNHVKTILERIEYGVYS